MPLSDSPFSQTKASFQWAVRGSINLSGFLCFCSSNMAVQGLGLFTNATAFSSASWLETGSTSFPCFWLRTVPVARGPREVFNKETTPVQPEAVPRNVQDYIRLPWNSWFENGNLFFFYNQSDVINRIMTFEFVYLFTTEALIQLQALFFVFIPRRNGIVDEWFLMKVFISVYLKGKL